jgi:hypothetical protein
MGKYMQLTNFFSKLLKQSVISIDDKKKLVRLITNIKRAEDLMFVVRMLNNFPNIFDGEIDLYKNLYKPYLNMCKSIKMSEIYDIYKYIPTEIYSLIINRLVIELGNELRVEETNLIISNINYILDIINDRNEFYLVSKDNITENSIILKVLISVILFNKNYPDIIYELCEKVYRNTDYYDYIKDELLDKSVYYKVFKKRKIV